MGKKPRGEKSTNEVVNNQKTDANNHNGRSETVFEPRNNYSKQQNRQSNEARYDHRIHDSKDYSSFKVVLFYCSLIVFLPVLTFFMLKAFLLDSLFTLTEIQGNIYAAVGAVISLHISLAVYIYRAYFSAGTSSDSTHKKTN